MLMTHRVLAVAKQWLHRDKDFSNSCTFLTVGRAEGPQGAERRQKQDRLAKGKIPYDIMQKTLKTERSVRNCLPG